MCAGGWWRSLSRVRESEGRAAEASRAADGARGEAAALERARGEDAERFAVLKDERDAASDQVIELSKQLAQVRQQLADLEELRKQLEKWDERAREAFKALSADSLKASREEFMAQAKPVFEAAKKEHTDLIKPIGETLTATREKLESIEKSRAESFAKLMTQVESAAGATREIREETARLTRALSRPEIRGQYGEIQLRRIAELAGMTSYCDFDEQSSQRNEDGELLRPDMVVSLPNKRVIAVDAKTNTYAYLEAVNAKDDAEREAHLERFARHVAEQAKKLSDKKYWSLWSGSADFVVMFIPGDHFIDAALERRPDLIDLAAQQNVILASPSTLIGLLRAVHVGWREFTLAEEARELFELGKELHDRAAVAFEHAGKLGDSIRQSVERYNRLVGSIDTRMMPTLKRFEDAGAKSAKSLPELKPLDGTPRLLESGE